MIPMSYLLAWPGAEGALAFGTKSAQALSDSTPGVVFDDHDDSASRGVTRSAVELVDGLLDAESQ
jgi:hypothetical protein